MGYLVVFMVGCSMGAFFGMVLLALFVAGKDNNNDY